MKLIVKKDDSLLNYLCSEVDIPRKRLKQYLTHGSIYVGNNKVYKHDYPLIAGMMIVIDTNSKNKRSLPFDILYEDNHMIVVNKPSGLLTIANSKEKEKTLYHIVREYLVSKDKFSKVFIVHRLDKDTSGVVVLAKDLKTKNILQENWDSYATMREYVAVVHGRLKKKSDRTIQYLKESKTNLVYTTKSGLGKEAITNYEVIRESNNYSMVDIKLETGRKNQIRVLFSTLGNSILGDKKYGDKRDKFSRLYLHANRLKLYHPYIKKDMLFETVIPNEFKKVISSDR